MGKLPVQILYESAKYVAINKPSQVAMQGTPYSPAGRAWQDFRRDVQLRIQAEDPLHVVHRLDAGTSGVLILAKSKRAASTLSQQFEKRQVSKAYLAVVQSASDQDGANKLQEAQAGFINVPLRTTDTDVQLCRPSDTDAACKESHTRWQHLASNGAYSLLQICPETGRKHQLRVHCSKVLGTPVVGDFKYGYLGPQIAGHLLHCHSISFYEWGPDGKRKTIEVTAPVLAAFARYAQIHALNHATIATSGIPP